MNDIGAFYDRLYTLSYITRYSGVPRIKDESVAEHSFYVASIVVKLHDAYRFDLGSATTMAIVHDWTEAWTDDVTVATKRAFPEIASAVKMAELRIANSEFSPIVLSHWSDHNMGNTVESKIVHMADVIQCIQYSRHEIKLGNDGYMEEVLGMSVRRLTKLEGELREYRK